MKIVDVDEKSYIFFEGTERECKEWWWNQLKVEQEDVGGFHLID